MRRQLRVLWKMGEWSRFDLAPRRRCSSTVSLDPWSMKFGVLPGRWTSSDAFNSSVTAGVFCGSSQRLEAMELRLTWGWRRRASSGGRRRWQNREVCIGSRGINVIFLFLRGLCAKGWDSFLLYPTCLYLYVYTSCTVLVLINTGTVASKKRKRTSVRGAWSAV